MNSAHWHLVFNHFPIIGTLGGIVVLFYGLIRKSNDTKVLGSFIVVAMAIMSVMVMQTGEAAEEIVEKIPGISEAAMEAHEDAAKIANFILIAAGVASLLTLLLHFTKRSGFNLAITGSLILSCVAFGFMAYTGYLGGKIRHTEITTTANSIQSSDTPATKQTGDGDED